MVPVLRRQRQLELCEFENSLVNMTSSRSARRDHLKKSKTSKIQPQNPAHPIKTVVVVQNRPKTSVP